MTPGRKHRNKLPLVDKRQVVQGVLCGEFMQQKIDFEK